MVCTWVCTCTCACTCACAMGDLSKLDADFKRGEIRVDARLARAQLRRPALGLEQREQGALGFVTEQVRHVTERLGHVLWAQRVHACEWISMHASAHACECACMRVHMHTCLWAQARERPRDGEGTGYRVQGTCLWAQARERPRDGERGEILDGHDAEVATQPLVWICRVGEGGHGDRLVGHLW